MILVIPFIGWGNLTSLQTLVGLGGLLDLLGQGFPDQDWGVPKHCIGEGREVGPTCSIFPTVLNGKFQFPNGKGKALGETRKLT